jgi:hypothetical protein
MMGMGAGVRSAWWLEDSTHTHWMRTLFPVPVGPTTRAGCPALTATSSRKVYLQVVGSHVYNILRKTWAIRAGKSLFM